MTNYRSHNSGRLLFEEFFEATPLGGYGTQRALGTIDQNDTDASILRQGIKYHQAGDYDLALVSLRAYLEGNPVQEEKAVMLLAAGAAMATGNYAEAREYVDELSESAPSAIWYDALLNLRVEDIQGAKASLTALTEKNSEASATAKELLTRLR